MPYHKIKNNISLVRDTDSNAIINTNKTEYENYISNYNRLKSEREELNNLKKSVSSLNSDMEEIKSLLKLLVKEKNNDN